MAGEAWGFLAGAGECWNHLAGDGETWGFPVLAEDAQLFSASAGQSFDHQNLA